MAGVGKDAVTVDVVAAARELIGANPQVRAETGSTPVHEAGERGASFVPSAAPWADPQHDVLGDVSEAMRAAEQHATDVFGTAAVQAAREAGICGLGHLNPSGARFCSTCGLPMDAPPPPGPAVAERPGPALTAEERAERDRQHTEAVAANMRADELVPDITQQEDPSEQKLRVHFVEDGFTWGGKVWQVGEEIEIGPEHPRWDSALPWITLSKPEQVRRYGRVFFESGPWPYQQIPPGTEIPLPDVNPRRVFEGHRSAAPARSGEDGTGSLVPL